MVKYKRTFIFCAIGALFTLLLGTLSHFFYGWSGKSLACAVFFPANESVWEHLKMVIFPSTVYFAIARLFFRESNNYTAACVMSQLLSCTLIVTLFYLYTSISKSSILAVDIIIYMISVLLGFVLSYFLMTRAKHYRIFNWLCVVGLIIILTCYFTFTCEPPHNALFYDALIGGYGRS